MKPNKLDRKRMIAIIVCGVMLFLGLVVFFLLRQYPHTKEFGTAGIFEEAVVQKAAEDVIALFTEQEYQEILDTWASEELKSDADTEDLEYAVIQVGSDWGGFREIGTMTLGEMEKAGKWYALAETKAFYENTEVTYTFSFDKNMKLAGIYLQ